MSDDHERARAYLWELTDGWISPATALDAEKVLLYLLDRHAGILVPTVAPGPDGLVGFTWRTERDYLSLELRSDGVAEFFHEDLETSRFLSLQDVRNDLDQLDTIFERLR